MMHCWQHWPPLGILPAGQGPEEGSEADENEDGEGAGGARCCRCRPVTTEAVVGGLGCAKVGNFALCALTNLLLAGSTVK
jgi:hypothetical protein